MANAKIYWLYTLSPTHVGAGRGVGYIDLPIMREKVTNWPVIPGSAFKGVWADRFGATDDKRKENSDEGRLLRAAFGRGGDDSSNAGSLIPTDARLVCLPVRSFHGTFAWCTSPLALQMLHRDLTLAGLSNLPPIPKGLNETEKIHHCRETLLKDRERIYLEDLDFEANACPTANAWAEKIADWVFPDDEAWRETFIQRFAVVHDTVFDFLTETGTEVAARVKIDDEMKTVVDGALWNEEALPAETILVGVVSCDRIYPKEAATPAKLLKDFATDTLTLQIGGKATVGRGRVRCVFTPMEGVAQ